MTTNRISLSAAALILVAAGTISETRAAPFEQPSPTAAMHLEVKLVSKFKDREDKHSVFGPAIDVVLPIQEGLATSFTLGREWKREGNTTRTGLSDLEWAVKWEIVPASGDNVYITTEPALIAPTASNGLSDGWGMEVPLVIGRKFGPWKLHGMLAYERAFRSDEDTAKASVLLYRNLTERFGMGLELAGDTALQASHDSSARLNLGFKWQMASDLELAARIGRSFVQPDGKGRENNAAIYLEKIF